jgi:putative glycosyltransferase protein
MKIAFCYRDFATTGGIERVSIVKMNALVERGHEVYAITTDQGDTPCYFPLDPRVKHIDLGINYCDFNGLSRPARYFKSFAKKRLHKERMTELLMKLKLDFLCVVSDMKDSEFVFNIPDGSVKIMEHHGGKYWNVNMYRYAALPFHLKFPRIVWGHLMTKKLNYYDRKYDRLVTLTHEDARDCRKHCSKVSVIPNPMTFAPKRAIPSVDAREKVILSVGRLALEKNVTELIDMWAMIAHDYPDWKLRIVGEGYLHDSVVSKIRHLGLEKQIELCPFTQDVEAHYARASIFTLTSFIEGFGLVLIEAETMGLPAVAYACKCGPRDIIRDGVDGFLAEQGDQATFIKGLRRLMDSEDLRRQMGEAAKANAERFSLDNVMKQWEALFAELTTK